MASFLKAVLNEVLAENKLEGNQRINFNNVGWKSDEVFHDSENEEVGNDHYMSRKMMKAIKKMKQEKQNRRSCTAVGAVVKSDEHFSTNC